MIEIAPRRITLCADDYGLSPGVNRAIRELISLGRLSATSVMMVGPAVGRDEISELTEATRDRKCQIGLHATLTAPFHPLTFGFRPLHGALFPPVAAMLRTGVLRRLDPQMIEGEVVAQIVAFSEAFRRPPDYIDGHQHVQLFPQVRDGFLAAVRRTAPQAWVRQCGRAARLAKRLQNRKALLLDVLSLEFRRRAARSGLGFNAAFAGAYDFSRGGEFGVSMRGFLDDIPDGGLVMCHPGFVDDVLVSLDPLTGQREREHAYLASDRFAADLAARNIVLG